MDEIKSQDVEEYVDSNNTNDVDPRTSGVGGLRSPITTGKGKNKTTYYPINPTSQRLAQRRLQSLPSYAQSGVISGMGSRGVPMTQQMPEYGESRYDAPNPSLEEYYDYQNLRGERQSGFEQIMSGIGKGSVIAGTSFVDTYLGTLAGIINTSVGIAQGENAGQVLNRFVSNPVSEYLQEINKQSEEWMPNYTTSLEDSREWYQNLGTANFWGDHFLKNLGFMVGAALSGRTVAAVMSKAMKLNKARDAFRGAVANAGLATDDMASAYRTLASGDVVLGSKAITDAFAKSAKSIKNKELAVKIGAAISGSVGESRIEAISNSNDYFDKYYQEIEDRRMIELSNAQDEFAANEINAKYDSYIEELNREKLNYANISFGANMLITSLENYNLFGDAMIGGYSNARRMVNLVKRNKNNAYVANKAASRKALIGGISTPLFEGEQEMAQQAITISLNKYEGGKLNSFVGETISEDGLMSGVNWLQSMINAMGQVHTDPKEWENFALGFLTALVPIPGISRVRSTEKSEDGKEKKGSVKLKLSGGLYDGISEYRDLRSQGTSTAEALNNLVKDSGTRSMMIDAIASSINNEKMLRAAENGDAFEFKNAEIANLVSHAMAFEDAGRADDFINMLEAAYTVNDNDIESIRMFGAVKDKKSDGTEEVTSLFDGMDDNEIKEYFAKAKEDVLNKARKAISVYRDITATYGEGVPVETRKDIASRILFIDDRENRIKGITDKIIESVNDFASPEVITKLVNIKDFNYAFGNEGVIDKTFKEITEEFRKYNRISYIRDEARDKAALALENVSDLVAPGTDKWLEAAYKKIDELRKEIEKSPDENKSNDIERLESSIEDVSNASNKIASVTDELAYIEKSIGEKQIAYSGIRNDINDLLNLIVDREKFMVELAMLSDTKHLNGLASQVMLSNSIVESFNGIVGRNAERVYDEFLQTGDERLLAYNDIDDSSIKEVASKRGDDVVIAALDKIDSIDKMVDKEYKSEDIEYSINNILTGDLIRYANNNRKAPEGVSASTMVNDFVKNYLKNTIDTIKTYADIQESSDEEISNFTQTVNNDESVMNTFNLDQLIEEFSGDNIATISDDDLEKFTKSLKKLMEKINNLSKSNKGNDGGKKKKPTAKEDDSTTDEGDEGGDGNSNVDNEEYLPTNDDGDDNDEEASDGMEPYDLNNGVDGVDESNYDYVIDEYSLNDIGMKVTPINNPSEAVRIIKEFLSDPDNLAKALGQDPVESDVNNPQNDEGTDKRPTPAADKIDVTKNVDGSSDVSINLAAANSMDDFSAQAKSANDPNMIPYSKALGSKNSSYKREYASNTKKMREASDFLSVGTLHPHDDVDSSRNLTKKSKIGDKRTTADEFITNVAYYSKRKNASGQELIDSGDLNILLSELGDSLKIKFLTYNIPSAKNEALKDIKEDFLNQYGIIQHTIYAAIDISDIEGILDDEGVPIASKYQSRSVASGEDFAGNKNMIILGCVSSVIENDTSKESMGLLRELRGSWGNNKDGKLVNASGHLKKVHELVNKRFSNDEKNINPHFYEISGVESSIGLIRSGRLALYNYGKDTTKPVNGNEKAHATRKLVDILTDEEKRNPSETLTLRMYQHFPNNMIQFGHQIDENEEEVIALNNNYKAAATMEKRSENSGRSMTIWLLTKEADGKWYHKGVRVANLDGEYIRTHIKDGKYIGWYMQTLRKYLEEIVDAKNIQDALVGIRKIKTILYTAGKNDFYVNFHQTKKGVTLSNMFINDGTGTTRPVSLDFPDRETIINTILEEFAKKKYKFVINPHTFENEDSRTFDPMKAILDSDIVVTDLAQTHNFGASIALNPVVRGKNGIEETTSVFCETFNVNGETSPFFSEKKKDWSAPHKFMINGEYVYARRAKKKNKIVWEDEEGNEIPRTSKTYKMLEFMANFNSSKSIPKSNLAFKWNRTQVYKISAEGKTIYFLANYGQVKVISSKAKELVKKYYDKYPKKEDIPSKDDKKAYEEYRLLRSIINSLIKPNKELIDVDTRFFRRSSRSRIDIRTKASKGSKPLVGSGNEKFGIKSPVEHMSSYGKEELDLIIDQSTVGDMEKSELKDVIEKTFDALRDSGGHSGRAITNGFYKIAYMLGVEHDNILSSKDGSKVYVFGLDENEDFDVKKVKGVAKRASNSVWNDISDIGLEKAKSMVSEYRAYVAVTKGGIADAEWSLDTILDFRPSRDRDSQAQTSEAAGEGKKKKGVGKKASKPKKPAPKDDLPKNKFDLLAWTDKQKIGFILDSAKKMHGWFLDTKIVAESNKEAKVLYDFMTNERNRIKMPVSAVAFSRYVRGMSKPSLDVFVETLLTDMTSGTNDRPGLDYKVELNGDKVSIDTNGKEVDDMFVNAMFRAFEASVSDHGC